MRKLFFSIVLIASITAIGVMGCIWLYAKAIDDSPSLNVKEGGQLDHADEVDKLLKALAHSLLNRDTSSTLEISNVQIESLQGFLSRSNIDVSGDAQLANTQGVIRMSLALTIFNERKFVNTELWLKSGLGVSIQKVKIGDVFVSGWLFKFIVEQGVNRYTRSDLGSVAFASVHNMLLAQDKIIVVLNPLADLLDELRLVDTGDKTTQELVREKYTVLFLRELERYEKEHGIRSRSLNDYIQLVFSLAQQQHADAVVINEAAILSLAIFTGHYRIGTLVGNVQLNADKPSAPNHLPTLANRHDLSQHFIISAALEILARQPFTLAVGEFKELMDRSEGGTGFSFVDLAADKAGVKFAVELSNPNKAAYLQHRIATGIQESTYFPNTNFLKEGITKAEFTQLFISVDSKQYTQEVDKVNERIDELGLYTN